MSMFIPWLRCSILILLGGTLAAQETATLSGIVRSAETRQPLPHAQVYLKGSTRGTVSDRNGKFRIEKLSPGTYVVLATLQGYAAFQSEVSLTADEDHDLEIILQPGLIEFDAVLISVNRSVDLARDLAQSVSVVTHREMAEKNTAQTPEALREATGVFVQKTNQGGGSPIIRGLKANKLLLLIDGIRLNNSTYRGGNFQYLNSVDPFSIDRIEIARGPVSVLYGSDALGGAVNVVTRRPVLGVDGQWEFGSSAGGQYSTADNTKLATAAVSAANDRIGAFAGFSIRSFGNIRRGTTGGRTLMKRLANDPRFNRTLPKTQSPLGYDAVGWNAGVLWKINDNQRLAFNAQSDRQFDVPRYDTYEIQQDSIRDTDPQERDLAYLSYSLIDGLSFFDVTHVTVSWQRQFEARLRQRFGRDVQNHDEYGVNTLGFQLQFNKSISPAWRLVYGVEVYHDDVSSSSFTRNTATNDRQSSDPMYPDGSTYLTSGAYVQADWETTSQWKWLIGARGSYFRLRAPFPTDTSAAINFGTVKQTPKAFAVSAGTVYRMTESVHAVANVAQGFRAPNLDDVGKFGAGQGAVFDVPHPDVGSEKTLSIDGGLKFFGSRLRGSVIGFYNRITDLLLSRPAAFKGSSVIVVQGDTLTVYHKANAGRAYTVGFEADVHVQLAARAEAYASCAYTYGQNQSQNEPIGGIPPFNGLVGIRAKVKPWFVDGFLRFAAEQSRLSQEEIDDESRIPPGGTPGWWTLNVRAGYDPGKHVEISGGLMNVFDWNYREHLSGFNAPGRSVVIGIRVKY
jgi:outer membrane receptor protein involved in Fe transport